MDFESTVRDLAKDSDVATPFTQKLLDNLTTMRANGTSVGDIRDNMGDWLFELKGVRAATSEPRYSPDDLWYFKRKLNEEDFANLTTLEAYHAAVTRTSPLDDNAYKSPYVFLGTDEQRFQAFANAPRISGETGPGRYPTLSAAWKDGHSVAFQADGTLRVNDASPLWRRVDDPVYKSNRYLNTRTGAFTEDTVLTAADKVMPGESMVIVPGGVKLPQKEGATKFIKMGEKVDPNGDTEYFTARHAWASTLQDAELPKVIDVTDFSLMDRLRTATPEARAEITIKSGENTLGNAGELPIDDVIKSAKLSESQRIFQEAFEAGTTADVRAVAYQLNVDAQWLENAVASRFNQNMAGISGEVGRTVDMSKGINLPLDSYTRRENLIADFARPQQFKELDAISPDMTWQQRRDLIKENTSNNGGQFVTGQLAWSYRVQQAIRANQTASAAVLGAGRHQLLLNLAQDAAKLADTVGVGASTLGSSNAGYGDVLKLWAQDTGKHVHNWIQDDVNAIVERMGASAVKLRGDQKASAELGIITNFLRGTDDKYVWNPTNPKQLMLRELLGVKPEDQAELLTKMKSEGRKPTLDLQNDATAEYMKIHSDINAERVNKRIVLATAKGLTSNMDPLVVYAPPIDTTYFKHFAFVRPVEGKAFGTSEVAMVFGRDAAELQKRMALVDRANFNVITKKETEDWFKAKDLYDFQQTINTPQIDSTLRRSGALSNQFPEVRAESLIEDYLRWHQNQAGKLVRDAVETNYAQQVAELRKLGEGYTEAATSVFAGTTKRTASEVVNPFDDYVKTALDVSKRSEYQFLHQANEFVDAMGVRAYRALNEGMEKQKQGLLKWDEVNAIAEKHGIRGPYSNQEEYFTANVPRDRNLVKETLTKANMFMANTLLRLDFFNAITNTVSTPILLGTEIASIKTALKNDPESLGRLAEAMSIKVPGGKTVQPAPPVQQGMVRMYHGGVDIGQGETGRWLTPDAKYAAGYASKSGDAGKVFYVDVPLNHPSIKPSYDATGTGMTAPPVSFASDPAMTAQLREFNPNPQPMQMQARVPSTTKLIANAIKNYFGEDSQMLLTRYRANGDIKDVNSQFHSMISDLAVRADYKAFSDGVNRAFEKGAKFTGNNLAEDFTRFVSADVMRQLTEDAVKAGKLSLQEQNAFISVFTNRVQGNYISSQRPVVFQGVLGSAVSLFQTYSFNLMQQLLRHVENKDKRAVGTLLGMQAGLFGLNGTPFFEAVNTHIIGNAAVNQGHYDAYSVAPQLLGKEVGDWLMYGTASAMPLIMGGKTPALYTRGDINPRHMTILPINPLDIPAIQAGTKVVQNLWNVASNIAGGAAIGPTLLQGLEHNGLNRPLAGFAQVMQGQATTSKGGLISASSDFDLVANASRILGSRPMDEAVALNNLYRVQAYRAADRDRTEQLGERVKSYLYKNQMPPAEVMDGFMKDFANTGGRMENFQGAMQRWMKDANQSTVEQVRSKMNSSYGQRLSEIMGGEPLPDWSNVQPVPSEQE